MDKFGTKLKTIYVHINELFMKYNLDNEIYFFIFALNMILPETILQFTIKDIHQCKQFSKIKTFEIISVSYVKLKIIYEIHSTYNLNNEVYFFIFALNMILPETILQFTIKDIHQCKQFSKIKTFEIISVSYVKLKIIYEIHSTYNLNNEVYFFIFALNMILPETIMQFTIKDIHQCKQVSKIKTFEIISVSYVKLKIIYEIHSTYNLNNEVYFFIFPMNMILPETILQFTIKDIHQCKQFSKIKTFEIISVSYVTIIHTCHIFHINL
jgi:ribosomal protein S17